MYYALDERTEGLGHSNREHDALRKLRVVLGSARERLAWALAFGALTSAAVFELLLSPMALQAWGCVVLALGAGVLASRLAGQNVERVLVDVSPYSFGVSYLGERGGFPPKWSIRANHTTRPSGR